MKEEEFKDFYQKYVDMVYRLTFTYFKGNKSKMEDVTQDVFLKVLEKEINFESNDHAKYWLIKTTTNMCKNSVNHWWNKNINIENVNEPYIFDKNHDVLDAVLSLPDKERITIYLYYYEGYSAKEISNILNKNENTIFGYLHQGRNILKERLGEDL